MSLRCRLVGHSPYVEDHPGTERLSAGEVLAAADIYTDELLDWARSVPSETVAVFGGVRRYCGRCGVTLPGDTPEVGDRMDSR